MPSKTFTRQRIRDCITATDLLHKKLVLVGDIEANLGRAEAVNN